MNTATADLSDSPRFQRSAYYFRQLFLLFLCGSATAFAILSLQSFTGSSLWRTLVIVNGSALLALVASINAAYWIACWRSHAAESNASPSLAWWLERHKSATDAQSTQQTAPQEAQPLQKKDSKPVVDITLVMLQRLGIQGIAETCLASLALLTLLIARTAWNVKLTDITLGSTSHVGVGLLLILAMAFGLLVVERYFAGIPKAELPEALPLSQLTRSVIATLLLSVVALFFTDEDRTWPIRMIVLTSVVPMLIAAELFLSALLSVFSPHNDQIEPKFLGDSILASLLRWPMHPLQNLQDEMQSRFGINLQQNWAFHFIRRAFVPVLLFVALIGWTLTGVEEIPLHQRGIYEKFGAPIAVWQPGLHAGLPWPWGRVLPVENGVVHELSAAVANDIDNRNGGNPIHKIESGSAEGPPPASANRLWDASHITEKSQVIASMVGNRQSFHVVNMDVRFIYRIGLTDTAAMAATYNSTDVTMLIRSTANRVLVKYFATRTLDGVLGQQRTQLATDIGTAVQGDLDALASGVEILATVVEAIHPPAGAADAYHSVQAAQISAQALIAREGGNAAESRNNALLNATSAKDTASAVAREALAVAEATRLRFNAEQNAYRIAGKAFLLEQYLSRLNEGLPNADLLIIDHRLGAAPAPTLDLRSYSALPYRTRTLPPTGQTSVQ